MHEFGIIYILLLLNLHESYCNTYKEFLADTLPDVCPYSTFCTMDPFKQFKYKKYSPCCKSCSCDDDCLTNGNCCPDFPAVHKVSPSMLTNAHCSAPVHYGYEEFETNLPTQHLQLGFYFHYIISTCPVEYNDFEVIKKCKSHDRQDLRNMVMVSDGKGRVFSNRYCAKCNNVQTFTRWGLIIICMAYTNNLIDISNLQAVNDNHCLVLSSPPTTEIAMASRCFPIHYDTCNATGRWEHFDSNVQRACESTTFPYVEDELVRLTTYKNPYCYLCNRGLDVQINKVCPLDMAIFQKMQLGVPFYALMDLSLLKDTKNEDTNRLKCQSTEIFDYHFEKCRPLHCPIAMLPLNGKCVPVFKETISIAMEVLINMTFVDEITRSFFNFSVVEKPDKEDIAKMQNIIRDTVFNTGNTKHACDTCQSALFHKQNKSGLIIRFGFRTNRQCDAVSILNSLKILAINRTLISVNSNGIPLAFNLEIVYDQQLDWATFEQNGRLGVFDRDIHCFTLIFLKPMFYCANVVIPWIDYINITSSDNSKFQIGDFAYVDDVYSICVDKYLENQKSGVTFNACPMITSIAMAVFVLLPT